MALHTHRETHTNTHRMPLGPYLQGVIGVNHPTIRPGGCDEEPHRGEGWEAAQILEQSPHVLCQGDPGLSLGRSLPPCSYWWALANGPMVPCLGGRGGGPWQRTEQLGGGGHAPGHVPALKSSLISQVLLRLRWTHLADPRFFWRISGRFQGKFWSHAQGQVNSRRCLHAIGKARAVRTWSELQKSWIKQKSRIKQNKTK